MNLQQLMKAKTEQKKPDNKPVQKKNPEQSFKKPEFKPTIEGGENKKKRNRNRKKNKNKGGAQ